MVSHFFTTDKETDPFTVAEDLSQHLLVDPLDSFLNHSLGPT